MEVSLTALPYVSQVRKSRKEKQMKFKIGMAMEVYPRAKLNLHEENERAILEWIRGSGAVGVGLGAGK